MPSEYQEHLLAHYLGRGWYAPLSAHLIPVKDVGGAEIGQVALAGEGDLARACALAAHADPPAPAHLLAAALNNAEDELAHAAALGLPTFTPPATAVARGLRFLTLDSPANLRHLLPALLSQPAPVIIRAAPSAALGAMVAVDVLHRSDLTRGRLFLLYSQPGASPGQRSGGSSPSPRR